MALARPGWTDIVQADKGPLPNPEFDRPRLELHLPTDHSKEITQLTLESMRQYKEMVFTECGGIEVARTEERMRSCTVECSRRPRSTSAEPRCSLPPSAKRRSPISMTRFRRFWTPSVGVVDSLRAGTIMREKAQEMNALTSLPNTEVMDIEVTDGHVSAVATDRGPSTPSTS